VDWGKWFDSFKKYTSMIERTRGSEWGCQSEREWDKMSDSSSMQEEVKENPMAFSVIGPTTRYTIPCASAADKKAVLKRFERAINEAMASMKAGGTKHLRWEREGKTEEEGEGDKEVEREREREGQRLRGCFLVMLHESTHCCHFLRFVFFFLSSFSHFRYGSFWEFPGGGRYEGWWKDGWMSGHGRFSIFGATYEGDFLEGNKCGKGRMTFPNKSEYDGEWKDNVPWGAGVMKGEDGWYDGEFVSGMREGKGKCEYECGDVYEGQWSNNLPHGVGYVEEREREREKERERKREGERERERECGSLLTKLCLEFWFKRMDWHMREPLSMGGHTGQAHSLVPSLSLSLSLSFSLSHSLFFVVTTFVQELGEFSTWGCGRAD
jgi:hypothetical protein